MLVQQTIDRIVFLRIAEDRNLEPESQLERAAQGQGVYKKLKDIYTEADRKYNSGLFHFDAADDSRPNPDKLSMEIYIPDSILRPIILDLYPPKSRYQFSVIAADILGQAYERFLGNVIEVRSDKYETTVAVREKPQVRKAGGVYYTPSYIVDYIVENTVGALLDGATPQQAESVRILDPACGSGSFLTGAYQYLLDWHLRQYARQPERYKNRISRRGDGYILNLVEKRRILTRNMFGVDLDQNAVEVSKLSLLLKMLEHEDENSGALDADGPLLPDLSGNIKWGNSLVGSDFYQGQRMDDLDDQDQEEMRRVKVFDWESAAGFGEVMADGGFDAVIGNPPYGAFLSSEQVAHLTRRHAVAAKFPDSYMLFLIKALELVKSKGLMSYIVPNTFCDLESCDDFRKWLLANHELRQIWQTGQAFKDAVVDTLVLVARRASPAVNQVVSIEKDGSKYERTIESFISNDLHKIDYRNSEADKQLLENILDKCASLRSIASVNAGVKMYERGKGKPPQTKELIKERPYSRKGKQPEGWRILYRGKDVARYSLAKPNEFVDYGEWLAAPRRAKLFDSPKILMRRTDDRLLASLDNASAICVNSCHVIRLKNTDARQSHLYLLGLLNSRLLQRIFRVAEPANGRQSVRRNKGRLCAAIANPRRRL